ncbi:MAG TPA: FAD-dependent oxidoreductase [Thermoplasmata archaeon]|jgi:ferredoxin-NADP reductase|nr:FAD-dependent oxidoreductase [Thermoplasmata archaeon]
MLPTVRGSQGPPTITTEIVSSWKPTPSTHAVRLRRPSGFHFRPTQFTFLGLPTDAGPEWHPMSLATSPTREHLEYAVRVSDSPFKQAFANLQPGDPAWVRGPFGEFFLNETRPAVLLAGGIGITPLKGMAEYASDRELEIPVRLLYSNRSEAEIVYRTELEQLAARNPRFTMHLTLTAEVPAQWTGETGRISADMVRRVATGLPPPMYYVCGTPQFVQDELAVLAQLGVPEVDLDWEPFRGY